MTVSYTVADGKGGTSVATLTIKVCGTNDAPTAVADTNSVKEDATVSGTVANDDGHVLTFALTDPDHAPAGLTLKADGSYTFNAADVAYPPPISERNGNLRDCCCHHD
ncbi:VCBS domain-containing protein [Phyllobacterium sp. 2063]|nr:VCBS domain-containing protein [Phyllobacterium sp. 2063]